jgi:hypothetical protein
MTGYKRRAIFRIVYGSGPPTVIDCQTAFSDVRGPVSCKVDYVPDVQKRMEVSRRSSPAIFGYRPKVDLTFDVVTTEDSESFETILDALRDETTTVLLSLDGCYTEREVVLTGFDGPNPLGGKTIAGARWILKLEASDLIDTIPAPSQSVIAVRNLLNLIPDGDFEAGTGWTQTTTGGTITLPDADALSGSGSCEFLRTTTGTLSIARTISRPSETPGSNVPLLLPGAMYEFSVYGKASANLAATGRLAFVDFTRKASYYLQASGSFSVATANPLDLALTTSWGQGSILFRAPTDLAGPDAWTVTFAHKLGGSNGSVWLDEARLRGPLLESGLVAW